MSMFRFVGFKPFRLQKYIISSELANKSAFFDLRE